MSKQTARKSLVTHSIECNCGDVIRVKHADDLERAKMEHLYSKHPMELLKGFIKAVPKVKSFGIAIGDLMRENLK
jgi:hypothetical protein